MADPSSPEPHKSQPWMSMRTGIIFIAVLSILQGVLTYIQVAPSQGWQRGILLGLIYGGFIWLIFIGFIAFNRWLRK